MKFSKLIIISAFLLSFMSPLTAQEWRWAADHSFLNPHVYPGTVGRIPGNGPTAFYDIDNDGIAELIVPTWESFNIIEQTGEFPDITWRISDENCFEDLNVMDDEFWYESFILQDLDQDDFPEVIVYNVPLPMRDWPPELRVFRNRGDYDNPDWIRDDELFSDIIGDIEEGELLIPHFCDWDSDGRIDLMLVHWDGFQRYEQDDDGNWEDLGVINGLHGGDVEFHLADFNGDSVLDMLSTDFWMMGVRRSAVYLNIGSVDEPEMSEPYSLDHFKMIQPFPYDINGDGRIDITNGNRFMLNTGEDELEDMWDRPVFWGMGLNSTSALYDFDNDGVLDLVKGVDLSFIDGGHWRFDQYQLTDAGWRDSQFFGYGIDEYTYNDWPEYRALKVVEMFNEGSPCLLKVVYSEFNAPRHRLTLLEDVDHGEGWRWQPVEHFFDSIMDTNLVYQTPSFGDLDGDGDQDMAMLEGAHSDSLGIVFYQLQLGDREPSWEVQEDWENGLDTVSFTMVSLADLDLDGDLDLVGTYLMEDRQACAILFQNTGDSNSPEWRRVQDAFDDGGPETEAVILTADVNGDGLSDILTERLCYINETQHSVHEKLLTPLLYDIKTYPNPFNAQATVSYSLNCTGHTQLRVFDFAGREVSGYDYGVKQAGYHSAVIDAGTLPSGLYIVQLTSSAEVRQTKMVCIK